MTGLGENLVPLLDLGWSTPLPALSLTGRGSFASLVHWQSTHIEVFAFWAWFGVVYGLTVRSGTGWVTQVR